MSLLLLTIGLQPAQSLEIFGWALCSKMLLKTLVLPSGEGVYEGNTILNVVEAFVLSSLAVFLEGYKEG